MRVLATGRATYPDASLVCGPIEGDPADPDGATITNPKILVEVLSPSIELQITSGAVLDLAKLYDALPH